MRGIYKVMATAGLVVLSASCAAAQAPADSAAKPSQPASATPNTNPSPAATATPDKPSTSQTTSPSASPGTSQGTSQSLSQPLDLPARTGPPLEDKNRQDFEKKAGEEAAKLLLRSEPSDSEIYVNGLYVGHTPLLMVVAPGKYSVEMRGARHETKQSTVGVMPKETQTVLLKLNQEYPGSISVKWPGQ